MAKLDSIYLKIIPIGSQTTSISQGKAKQLFGSRHLTISLIFLQDLGGLSEKKESEFLTS